MGEFQRKSKWQTNSSGAAKGLKEKMDYWRDKDYKYEYGVTIGLALGTAYNFQALTNKRTPTENDIYEIYDRALTIKNSDLFVDRFKKHWEEKANKDARQDDLLSDTGGGDESEAEEGEGQVNLLD